MAILKPLILLRIGGDEALEVHASCLPPVCYMRLVIIALEAMRLPVGWTTLPVCLCLHSVCADATRILAVNFSSETC